MTDEVIKAIIEIDKEFYTTFNYDDPSWYYDRYSDKNEDRLISSFLLKIFSNRFNY